MAKKTTSANRSSYKAASPAAKTEEQKEYLKSISKNTLTFVTGQAGTGKSFLAVRQGMAWFGQSRYQKLIFIRPAVEAYGERLGYLPGNADDKIAPYMMPLIEIMKEVWDNNLINSLINKEEIQTIPIAFLRGVTLKNAYIILDEAQNTSIEQMRLFLTRIGDDSKVVVTGDLNQSDMGSSMNGLKDAVYRFKDTEHIGIVKLTENSIVRSEIVKIIENKYSQDKYL